MNNQRHEAVRAPIRYAGSGDSFTRLTRLQAEFSGVLGADRVYVRLQGGEHFITGRPDDTLNYTGDEVRSGEPRYTWEDRGDGVLYGYRRSDDRSR
jgi:hypothetical protein